MDKFELHEMLRKLHFELKNIKTVDKESEDLLQNILTDINHIVTQDEEQSSEYQDSLSSRLTLAVKEFEDTHPTLAATMKQLIEHLSNIGI